VTRACCSALSLWMTALLAWLTVPIGFVIAKAYLVSEPLLLPQMTDLGVSFDQRVLEPFDSLLLICIVEFQVLNSLIRHHQLLLSTIRAGQVTLKAEVFSRASMLILSLSLMVSCMYILSCYRCFAAFNRISAFYAILATLSMTDAMASTLVLH